MSTNREHNANAQRLDACINHLRVPIGNIRAKLHQQLSSRLMTAPISIPTESNLTMNKPNLVIKMTITPRAPLSITMPATGIRSGNPYNNFPVMPCGKDDEGELIETGYLPASTIRGIMRRGAAMPQIEAHAGGVSAATAYELVVGQTAESEKERDRIDLEAIAGERETKPLVDLFGAGLGMKSRLNFLGHFMPETPIMPFPIASVRKDLDSTPGVLELLTEKDKEFSISRVELNSRRAAAEGLAAQLERKLMSKRYPLPEEEVPGVEKELAEANKLVKVVKSEIEERLGKDAMRVSTRAIFQHWAMPPNIPLSGHHNGSRLQGARHGPVDGRFRCTQSVANCRGALCPAELVVTSSLSRKCT